MDSVLEETEGETKPNSRKEIEWPDDMRDWAKVRAASLQRNVSSYIRWLIAKDLDEAYGATAWRDRP